MISRIWHAALAAANITLWWRFGAALIVSMGVGSLIMIIHYGPWSLAVEAARLDWLGWIAVLLIINLIIIIVALFDFRLALSANRSGFSMTADGDHDGRHPSRPPPPTPPPLKRR